jgi:hypothetical protein
MGDRELDCFLLRFSGPRLEAGADVSLDKLPDGVIERAAEVVDRISEQEAPPKVRSL